MYSKFSTLPQFIFVLCTVGLLSYPVNAAQRCESRFQPHQLYWEKLGYSFYSCTEKDWVILRARDANRTCVALNPSFDFAFWQTPAETSFFEGSFQTSISFHRLTPSKDHHYRISKAGGEIAASFLGINLWVDRKQLSFPAQEASVYRGVYNPRAMTILIDRLPAETYEDIASGNVVAIRVADKADSTNTDLWFFSLRGSRNALETMQFCLFAGME